VELKNLRLEIKDGIATVVLDRPSKRNALSPELLNELSACLDEASGDREVGALIITGGKDVFSAGMDMGAMVELPPAEIHSFWTLGYNQTYEKIYNFRVPVIAAVAGYALAGGFDLAISCDFRIASETAKFGQLEVNVGLTPGIERLWRLVGLSRAKYLGLTGETIDVQEAYRIGLVDRIAKSDELLNDSTAFAMKFVDKPREALERAKQSYGVVLDMDHRAAINWETLLLSRLLDSAETRAIMQRFLRR
jgi:enoyl-CoA hydratase